MGSENNTGIDVLEQISEALGYAGMDWFVENSSRITFIEDKLNLVAPETGYVVICGTKFYAKLHAKLKVRYAKCEIVK